MTDTAAPLPDACFERYVSHDEQSMILFVRMTILLMLLVSMLYGCGGIPIKSHPTDENFVKKRDFDALIGESKDVIRQKYGKPDWAFSHKDFDYFLYTSPGEIDLMWDIFIPFIVLPGSIYDVKNYRYCALLKFNKSEELLNIQQATGAYYDVYGSIVNFCLRHFFAKEDAELLNMEHEQQTPNMTGTGDH
jgi:hypothetical protein